MHEASLKLVKSVSGANISRDVARFLVATVTTWAESGRDKAKGKGAELVLFPGENVEGLPVPLLTRRYWDWEMQKHFAYITQKICVTLKSVKISIADSPLPPLSSTF